MARSGGAEREKAGLRRKSQAPTVAQVSHAVEPAQVAAERPIVNVAALETGASSASPAQAAPPAARMQPRQVTRKK